MPRGKRSKKTLTSNIEFQVVSLIILSILLAILIYTKSGYIGENLSPILRRISRLDKIYYTFWNYINSFIYNL